MMWFVPHRILPAYQNKVASLVPGTGIGCCGCFLPDLTRFTA